MSVDPSAEDFAIGQGVHFEEPSSEEYCPAGHFMQPVTFAGEKCPLGQGLASPRIREAHDLPAGHGWHSELLALETKPVAQGVHDEAPVMEYVPAGHLSHDFSFVAIGLNVPKEHCLHSFECMSRK